MLFILFSCAEKNEEKNSLKYFEFSFDNTFETCFTLIYKPNDSIYIQEHWSYNDLNDSVKFPKSKTNYSAKISFEGEKKLIKLVSELNLKNLESKYFEKYSDGITYSIFVEKDSTTKLINVHSHNVPKEIDSLENWIYKFKKNLVLYKTEKKLNSKTENYVLPPPPPPPPLAPSVVKNKNDI